MKQVLMAMMIMCLMTGCALFTQDNYDLVLVAGKTLLVEKGLPAANNYIDKMVTEGKITQSQADLLKKALLKLAEEIKPTPVVTTPVVTTPSK